jgi:hypothetical protein
MMTLASLRARPGIVLAVALLPLCVFADPLRLQFVRGDSSITDVPELSAQALQERTRYGLTQAVAQGGAKATLVPIGAPERPEVLVAAKLGLSGEKYRLVYIVQTAQEPRLTRELAYEFKSPQLTDRGVTAMAQEIITEAVKLEEERKKKAAEEAQTPVAETPAPSPAPAPSSPESPATPAPAAEAPRQAPPSPTQSDDGYASSEYSRPQPKPQHRLDLGVASGFNSPSGILGLEGEYRPRDNMGVHLGGGIGAWGNRITPAARLYPIGISSASPFVEAGLSLNLGRRATVTPDGGQEVGVELLPTPVATTSVGVRFNVSHVYFTPRVGWGFRLRQENFRGVNGTQISELERGLIGLLQHGGFLFSFAGGVTFL